MNEQLFRKKSIEKVSSPEQLNEYIRVSNPGVWMILAAIVLLLIGVCVWGVLGHLDTTVTTVAVVENSEITVYVRESDIEQIQEGMKVTIGNSECEITDIAGQPVAVGDDFPEYALHIGKLKIGEWVYPVAVSGEADDGIHGVDIVVESVSPMSFVIN
ncbi:MAG: hypothetical protein IKM25_01520 [Clostridia bacterium]|nr:hypothetical protein [Clostridia bacterium]